MVTRRHFLMAEEQRLDEHPGGYAETPSERLRLPRVDLTLSVEYRAYDRLPAQFGPQVGLSQAVLFHEQPQHFARLGVRHCVLTGLVSGHQVSYEIEQTGERMALVLADEVEQSIHERHGMLILLGCLNRTNAQIGAKSLPGALGCCRIELPNFHFPLRILALQRSYSACV